MENNEWKKEIEKDICKKQVKDVKQEQKDAQHEKHMQEEFEWNIYENKFVDVKDMVVYVVLKACMLHTSKEQEMKRENGIREANLKHLPVVLNID